MTTKQKESFIRYVIEGIITAILVMMIFLVAVGPKSFGESAMPILVFSFVSAGVAIGCTKIIFEEVMKLYEGSHKKNAD